MTPAAPHLHDAREHSQVLRVLPSLLHEPVHVGRELVEEVVDYVRREDSHASLVRMSAGVVVDLDVEREDGGVFWGPLALSGVEHRY